MRIVITFLVCIVVAQPASAQSGENVIVLVNDNSAASRTIGDYYAAKRGVPQSNVLHIRTPVQDAIDRNTFTNAIEWPLRTLLSVSGITDRVLYVVLTKDVPIRIAGPSGPYGTAASVDSELTLLYRRMVGSHVPTIGYVSNPYFAQDGDPAPGKSFTHRDYDIFLVSRLDAFTVDDVFKLIDRAAEPARDAELRIPDTLIRRSAQPSPTGSDDEPFPAGSISIGTPPYRAEHFRDMSFAVSQPTGQGHSPGVTVGEVIRRGVTAISGESSVIGTNPIHQETLFAAYSSGASAVEAFYRAMPNLSAGTVVVADPLSAPFRRTVLTRAEIESGDDAETALPAFFAERRIAIISSDLAYLPRPAVLLSVKAALYLERGKNEEARVLLEQATAMAPEFASAQLTLGNLYFKLGDHDRAIERFKLTLDASPAAARDEVVDIFGRPTPVRVRVVAMNNLAYALAVYRHAASEALPLAIRALANAPGDPDVLDTIAWIEHLLGQSVNAASHVHAALAAGHPTAAIHLHAAAILATSGPRTEAAEHLNEAVRLEPGLAATDDVAEIRVRLAAAGPD